MFCLANSIVFHLLPQGKVPSSFKHHYSGTVYPTLSNTVHPQHHLNLPSKPIFSPLDSECLACVYAAVCHWFHVCVHVLEVMRKLLNEVLCVYLISRVHCAYCFCIVHFRLMLGVNALHTIFYITNTLKQVWCAKCPCCLSTTFIIR